MSSSRFLIIILIVMSCARTNKKTDNYIIEIKKPELYILSDTVKYSDFQVVMDDNNQDNFFSSSDSTFSRRYFNGVKRIMTFLSVTEKREIYKAVKKYDFFGLPNIIEEGGTNYTCISPAFSTKITVIIGNNQKSVYYSGACSIKDKQIDYRFSNLEKLINEIIFSKKEINQMEKSDIIYH